ncbi:hypothetical protein ACLKA7_000582 [Drosophila subpalustris]
MTGTRSGLWLWPILILIIGLTAGQGSAVDCPAECECDFGYQTRVNCSHRGLVEFPTFDNGPNQNISYINLSGNRFKEFPRQYSFLTIKSHLDLSDNYIDKLDEDALKGFAHLYILSLANNLITSWADINANVSFTHAKSLTSLNLSGNSLDTFGFDNGLISDSIVILDISSAHIRAVNSNWPDQLPKLHVLYMANNNLSKVRQLTIPYNASVLDISNCSLQQINLTTNRLHFLNLSYNPAMQLNFNDILFLELRKLDLSYCNLDKIDLANMFKIDQLQLRGNNLESVNTSTFANNPNIEYLDLSENDLRLIDSKSFSSLKSLSKLNLANNKIVQLDKNLISSNYLLEDLDLSHNNIQRLTKIISRSVTKINLSWCNISTIESTALSSLSAIETLDLSHNLIQEIPYQLASNTLRYLNLSHCRIFTIDYNKFQNFPQLEDLHLNGNQLTSPVNSSHFEDNQLLKAIWLADNPWICYWPYPVFVGFQETRSGGYIEVRYLYSLDSKSPTQIVDYDDLQCQLPSSKGKMFWLSIMLSILGISLLLLAIYILCCRCKRNQPENRTDCDTNVRMLET